jgi:hypothetical protein
VLGVPADELTDRQVPPAEFRPAAEVRHLAEADDPMTAGEGRGAAMARRGAGVPLGALMR